MERLTPTCPSSSREEGAAVLGVMTPGGRLAFVQPPTRIDAEFAEHLRSRSGASPQTRLRFSGPCREKGCPQWTGQGCFVVDHVLGEGRPSAAQPVGKQARLPRCGIRASCRWFFQRGPDACSVCPLIVADTGSTDTYRSLRADARSSKEEE